MPVSFLSPAQHDSYGQYLGDPSTQELARYFHLDASDHTQIVEKRGDANRLGFALQARAGRWLEDAERTYAAILMVEPDSVKPRLEKTARRCQTDSGDCHRGAARSAPRGQEAVEN